jgi:hypothetical protein
MSGTDFFDDDLGQRRSAIRTTSMGQGTDIVAPKHDEVPVRPISDLNLTRMARHREEVNAQVAGAKLEIEKLRRKQSDLEREKQTLEDLSDKQDRYERGKQEMIDRLAESLVSLEKLADRASRQVEVYSGTRKRFGDMLAELQGLSDAGWTDENLREELNKAVVLIDNLRQEFVKSQASVEAAGGPPTLFDEERLRAVAGPTVAEEAPRAFGSWMKIGLAVSLPLMVLLLIVVIVLIVSLAR